MHAGILIDKKILLDVGEKTFLKCNPLCVFITHLHPDHAFFMASRDEITISVPVFAPERSERLKTMSVVSRPMNVAGYRITPIPVIHSVKVRSLGYLVKKDNKQIFYTGDIVSVSENCYKRLGKLDLVITEASFLRKGGLVRKNKQGEIFGHTGVPDLVNLFEKFTTRIIFTHFGTRFLRDISSGIKKIKSFEKKNLKLDIAIDGAQFEI